MKTTRDIIAEWPIEDVVEATWDWTHFERRGAIGDCRLRSAAQSEIERIGIGDSGGGVTRMMHDIAFEAYRRLAQQHPAMKP